MVTSRHWLFLLGVRGFCIRLSSNANFCIREREEIEMKDDRRLDTFHIEITEGRVPVEMSKIIQHPETTIQSQPDVVQKGTKPVAMTPVVPTAQPVAPTEATPQT